MNSSLIPDPTAIIDPSTVLTSVVAASSAPSIAPAPQFGSPAALNLLYSAAPYIIGAFALGAGAMVGGLYLTYQGVKLGYKYFGDLKEEKFINEIDELNAMHEGHLMNLAVYGLETQISLPPPFSSPEDKKNNKKKRTFVDAIHFTDPVIAEKGSTKPQGTDRELSRYMEFIFVAMQELKGFYFSLQVHKSGSEKNADIRKENGVTRAFISYLLEMLDTHCFKFEGYDVDIAILKGLAGFINEYQSREKSSDSRDFSRLRNVVAYIQKARDELIIHKDTLNLHQVVKYLNNHCSNLSYKLIKSFAILTNKYEHREILKYVTMELLELGKLKEHYIKSRKLGGLYKKHDNEIPILDSPFKKCLMELSQYELNVINSDVVLIEQDIPNVNIEIPDIILYRRLRMTEKLTDAESEQMKEIQAQLNRISKAFDECRNFVTKKVHRVKNEDPHFVPITDKDEDEVLLVERTKVLYHLAALIREIIKLQYYMNQLGDGLQKLGEIYVTNENKMQLIDRINMAFDNIIASISTLTKDFKCIDFLNNRLPDLKEEEDIRDLLNNLLKETNKIMVDAQKNITDYWENNKGRSKELKKEAKAKLNAATDLLIKPLKPLSEDHEEKPEPTIKSHPKRNRRNTDTGRSAPLAESGGKSPSNARRSMTRSTSADAINTSGSLDRTGKLSKFLPTAAKKLADDSITNHSPPPEKTKSFKRKLKQRLSDPFHPKKEEVEIQPVKKIYKEEIPEQFQPVDDGRITLTETSDHDKPFEDELVLKHVSIIKKPSKNTDNSPEVMDILKHSDYLNRLAVIKTTINCIHKIIYGEDEYDGKIITESSKSEIRSFIKLHDGLVIEYDKLKIMIDEKEKLAFYHKRIDKLLALLHMITSDAEVFFTANLDLLKLDSIKNRIVVDRYKKYIDHYEGWTKAFFNYCTGNQTLFGTENRINLIAISNTCDEIKTALSQRQASKLGVL